MIELAAVIRELRLELQAAVQMRPGDEDLSAGALRLELGPIELEAQIEVARDQQASGKIRFWVVDAGAEVRNASTSIQRIKLVLQPSTGVTGESAWVGDAQDPGER